MSLFLSLAALLSAGVVLAVDSSLSVSPSVATQTLGQNFNLSVLLTPTNDKICAVEGTIVFDKLSCQSINVSSDLVSAKAPTCQSPSFQIGIPSCSTLPKTLMNVVVSGSSAGQSSLGFSKIKIVNNTSSVPAVGNTGNYTIVAVANTLQNNGATNTGAGLTPTAGGQNPTEEVLSTTSAGNNQTAAVVTSSGFLSGRNLLILAVLLLIIIAVIFLYRRNKNNIVE